jgi:hypothetical protein
LLDGNLSGAITNEDGAEVVRMLREAPGGEDLFIISMSGTGKLIPGANMKMNKHEGIENPDGPVGVVKALEGYLSTSLGHSSDDRLDDLLPSDQSSDR